MYWSLQYVCALPKRMVFKRRCHLCLFLALTMFAYHTRGHSSENLTDLYLIGFFPISGPVSGGKGILSAALMAIDDINRRPDILPGYRLNMTYIDTECKAGRGIKALADYIYQPPTKVMIIGAGCSSVSQVVAQAAQYWNLIQISYVSISPALSDRKMYPNFFRIVNSEVDLNKARLAVFKQYKWERVAILYQDLHIFSKMVEDLVKRFKEENIHTMKQRVFTDNPESSLRDLKVSKAVQKRVHPIHSVKDDLIQPSQDTMSRPSEGEQQQHNHRMNDSRIIVGGFYADKARKVFCAAYNMGFYGKHVWVTTAALSYDKQWWKANDSSINCTQEQLEKVLKYTLIVSNIYKNMDETDEGLTGMSVQNFHKRYKKMTVNRTQLAIEEEYGPIGYDSVWAAALALNKTLSYLTDSDSGKTLANFSYDDKEMADLIKSKVREVSFKSVSGHVKFNANGDGVRLMGVDIIQGGDLVRVGKYDERKPEGEKLQIKLKMFWENIPSDSMLTMRVDDSLPGHAYSILTSIAGLGIILAISFLIFNIVNRNVKIIRMSSPNINNIILIGCILAYISVFVEDIESTKDSTYCKVESCLLILAFSLAYGALFAKTWRVYAIFTASLQLKKRVIKDYQLILMTFGFVCLNSLILCIWFLVDPPTVKTVEIPNKKVTGDDMIIQYVHNFCYTSTPGYFFITIMIIQGMFIFLGVFLAWETRKVKLTVLNESRYVGMCIYNLMTLGVVGILVSYSLGTKTSLVHIIFSCITILCTTVTQCLLFVPKVLTYREYVKGNMKNTDMSETSISMQIRRITTGTQTDLDDDDIIVNLEMDRTE